MSTSAPAVELHTPRLLLRRWCREDRRCRPRGPARALHESCARQGLERAQLLAYRGLHVAEATRRSDEGRLLGDRLEAEQVAELDPVPLPGQRYEIRS